MVPAETDAPAAPQSESATVGLVCNAMEMASELPDVREAYLGSSGDGIDVTAHADVTRLELVGLLRAGHHVHFVGHVDEDGICCADGALEPQQVGPVGLQGFVLNACDSESVGRKLVEAGADGGVVTVEDVSNAAAAHVGKLLANRLRNGATLGAAVEYAADRSTEGDAYRTVGDESVRPLAARGTNSA